mgnify:CR=1 FL=1
MPQFVFNTAKGKVNEYAERVIGNDPANSAVTVVLLQASEADAVLEDYDNLALLLAAGGNTEADFTNYGRIDVTNPTVTVDDTNNWSEASIGDQTWASAGGVSDNTLTKILICYNPDTVGGTDSDIIPMTADDFAATTNGQDLTALEDSNGFFRAT